MDPRTGHLIDRSIDDYELRRRGLDPAAYLPVPETHRQAARAKLAKAAEAVVARHSGGKLSRLGADMRREQRLAQKTARKRERKARSAAKAARRQRRSVR